MRLICVIILGVFTFTSVYAQQWQLRRDKKNIKVYTRKIGDSKILEFKAESQYDFPLEKIWTVIKDVNKHHNWISDCKTSKRLDGGTENHFEYYLEFKAPWPVKNREIVVAASEEITDKGIIFKMKSTGVTVLKNKENVIMPKLEGSWELIKISENKTKLVHRVHAEPGGNVPLWLANLKVTDGPLQTLLNLKVLLNKKN